MALESAYIVIFGAVILRVGCRLAALTASVVTCAADELVGTVSVIGANVSLGALTCANIECEGVVVCCAVIILGAANICGDACNPESSGGCLQQGARGPPSDSPCAKG